MPRNMIRPAFMSILLHSRPLVVLNCVITLLLSYPITCTPSGSPVMGCCLLLALCSSSFSFPYHIIFSILYLKWGGALPMKNNYIIFLFFFEGKSWFLCFYWLLETIFKISFIYTVSRKIGPTLFLAIPQLSDGLE